MPFAELEGTPLCDYLARHSRQPGLWFFLHIPKTAGSSFSTEMERHVGPYRNVEVDYRDESLSYDEKLTAAVDRFAVEMRGTRFRSASGHVPWELLGRITARAPDTRLITFLRDPQARLLSDYRYQRTPMHPQHGEFKARFPTLESYLDTHLARNQLTRFLFGARPTPSPDELIDHVRTNFAFIGLVEMYPFSFGCLFSAMGRPDLRPVEYQRKTEDSAETRIEITPALAEAIRQANSLDQVIYDYVKSVLMRHRDDWNAGQTG